MNEKRQLVRPIEELSQSELREMAEEFLRRLNVVRKQALFYPEEHPILQESIDAFKSYITGFIEDYGRFRINIHEGQAFLFNIFVPQLAVDCRKFVEELEAKEIKELTVLPGLTRREIYDFAIIMNEKKEALDAQGGLQTAIADAGITHLMVTSAAPEELKAEREAVSDGLSKTELSKEFYLEAIGVIKELADEILSGRPISVSSARRVVDTMVDSVLANPEALIRLSVLKNYDEDTYFHSVNVLVLSLSLGAAINLDRAALSALGLSALLHDIGKIKIPLDILRKPTSLSIEEWEIVKKHPILGAESLLGAKGLNRLAIVVAMEHHLGYDMKGYPRIQTVQRPHLFSRIVEVVDVYDALTSQRAYRKPALPDNALRLIYSQAGKKLDPVLARAFVRLMGIYPVGCVVKLTTEEYGVVIAPGREDLTRPKVKVVLNADLEPLDPPIVVDLTAEARAGGRRTTILESVEPARVGINPEEHIFEA
jgi:HD-GYP domain-containing protein (c-di-GMP phosphodiesterase class II)